MGTLNLSSTASLTPSVVEGPAFYVARDGSQSISNTTWSRIDLFTTNSGGFDTNSCWNNSNSRFTPNVAGYYQIQFTLAISTGSLLAGRAAIYKNGGRWATTELYMVSGDNYDDFSTQVCSLLYLNGSTDYVEFYCWRNGGSGTVGGASDVCQASGFLARQA
jgi:hypothetical protein